MSERIQLLEHYIVICHLLHVLAFFDRHQLDFTTYMETNTEVEISSSQLILRNM